MLWWSYTEPLWIWHYDLGYFSVWQRVNLWNKAGLAEPSFAPMDGDKVTVVLYSGWCLFIVSVLSAGPPELSALIELQTVMCVCCGYLSHPQLSPPIYSVLCCHPWSTTLNNSPPLQPSRFLPSVDEVRGRCCHMVTAVEIEKPQLVYDTNVVASLLSCFSHRWRSVQTGCLTLSYGMLPVLTIPSLHSLDWAPVA